MWETRVTSDIDRWERGAMFTSHPHYIMRFGRILPHFYQLWFFEKLSRDSLRLSRDFSTGDLDLDLGELGLGRRRGPCDSDTFGLGSGLDVPSGGVPFFLRIVVFYILKSKEVRLVRGIGYRKINEKACLLSIHFEEPHFCPGKNERHFFVVNMRNEERKSSLSPLTTTLRSLNGKICGALPFGKNLTKGLSDRSIFRLVSDCDHEDRRSHARYRVAY